MDSVVTGSWTDRFSHVVDSEAGLRELIGEPGDLVRRKQIDRLDHHCRAFIGLSPFVLVGSVGTSGGCDVSPRGDAPGFVEVLDDATLVLPDRPGNRRVDTHRNVLETGSISLLFLVPGFEEVLRINGRACLVRDPDLMERLSARGKQPLLAIGVHVDEAYFHCAKAAKRSRVWEPDAWPDASAFPRMAEVFRDHAQICDRSVDELDEALQKGYRERLY
jgi:PPOX class probable FMN-dependent enzyme